MADVIVTEDMIDAGFDVLYEAAPQAVGLDDYDCVRRMLASAYQAMNVVSGGDDARADAGYNFMLQAQPSLAYLVDEETAKPIASAIYHAMAAAAVPAQPAAGKDAHSAQVHA